MPLYSWCEPQRKNSIQVVCLSCVHVEGYWRGRWQRVWQAVTPRCGQSLCTRYHGTIMIQTVDFALVGCTFNSKLGRNEASGPRFTRVNSLYVVMMYSSNSLAVVQSGKDKIRTHESPGPPRGGVPNATLKSEFCSEANAQRMHALSCEGLTGDMDHISYRIRRVHF